MTAVPSIPLPAAALLALAAQDIDLSGGNILACETYSLNSLFGSGRMTLEKFPETMRGLGIRGVALNDIYFKSWDPEYLRTIKAAIERNGRAAVAFIIDHNGDFALEDEAKRRENIEAVKKRLETARFFGVPVVRINVGGTGKGDKSDRTVGVERVADAFRQLLPRAKELGLKLSIENHWGASTHAESVRRIIRSTDPQWVGSCLDFKNWAKGDDPYASVEMLAPHAFHTHAKSHAFDEKGEETGIDYARVLRALNRAGYRGAVSIEWEGGGDPIEGVKKTRDLIVRHWKGTGKE